MRMQCLCVFKLQWCDLDLQMVEFHDLSCRGRGGHKKKGPSSQIYRPGTESVIKFSLAFVALSFTLERGEMAFKEVL
jgi:hypothetical protein